MKLAGKRDDMDISMAQRNARFLQIAHKNVEVSPCSARQVIGASKVRINGLGRYKTFFKVRFASPHDFSRKG